MFLVFRKRYRALAFIRLRFNANVNSEVRKCVHRIFINIRDRTAVQSHIFHFIFRSGNDELMIDQIEQAFEFTARVGNGTTC